MNYFNKPRGKLTQVSTSNVSRDGQGFLISPNLGMQPLQAMGSSLSTTSSRQNTQATASSSLLQSTSTAVTPFVAAETGPARRSTYTDIGCTLTALGGDGVLLREPSSVAGVPVVYRTPEERAANPDRLNLDRRRLRLCPFLEGEERLRLLNYQHNMISHIEHLSPLKRLIFLDLYDNQIEEISGLSALKALRVLMLGKNRIRKIENLDNLTKLDVLDLHGNEISVIENLSHLEELRVLNLAGNQIRHVSNLTGMDALAELNLRRNKIVSVREVDQMPNLQRLFLSFNEITSFEDVTCLKESCSLTELSLDGNPFAQDQHYKQTVLSYVQQLRQLDMRRISEEERRYCMTQARKEEERRRTLHKTVVAKEKRRQAISSVQKQWEVMQSSLLSRSSRIVKMPDLYANHLGTFPLSDRPLTDSTMDDGDSIHSEGTSRPSSGRSTVTNTSTDSRQIPSEKATPVTATLDDENCPLAEIDTDTLTFYGPASLEALDRSWGVQAAGAITNVVFKFVDFNDISQYLQKMCTRFPAVQSLTFHATNLKSLQQINSLSVMRKLDSITLSIEGNPVVQFSLWRPYLLFRLSHLQLKKINDTEITLEDQGRAERMFSGLAEISGTLSLSQILSLLSDHRRKQILLMLEEKAKASSSERSNQSANEHLARFALVYTPPDALTTKEKTDRTRQDLVHPYLADMVKEAVFTHRLNTQLLAIWPQIFYDMLHNVVMEMSDTKTYMKKWLADVDKSVLLS